MLSIQLKNDVYSILGSVLYMIRANSEIDKVSTYIDDLDFRSGNDINIMRINSDSGKVQKLLF